jgi:hypothetical protein
VRERRRRCSFLFNMVLSLLAYFFLVSLSETFSSA